MSEHNTANINPVTDALIICKKNFEKYSIEFYWTNNFDRCLMAGLFLDTQLT